MNLSELVMKAKLHMNDHPLSVLVVDTFIDDHITCCTSIINGVKIDLMWVGDEFVEAAKYQDSPKAQQFIAQTLVSKIEGWVEEVADVLGNGEDVNSSPAFKLLWRMGITAKEINLIEW